MLRVTRQAYMSGRPSEILRNTGKVQQLDLFPYDPFGTSSSVGIVAAPAPGIAFACAAPIAVNDESALDASVTCLAVSSCRAFAVRITTTQRKLLDGDAWNEVKRAFEVRVADSTFWPSECVSEWRAALLATTPTQEGKWSKAMSAWKRQNDPQGNVFRVSGHAAMMIENSIRERHKAQVDSAFAMFLTSLRADVLEVMCDRQDASIFVVSKLLNFAFGVDGPAYRWAINALKTECLGLLHWLASDCEQGELLRDDLLNGRSLQKRLASWDIPPVTHRASLRNPFLKIQENANLSDMLVTSTEFQAAARVLSELPELRWPRSEKAALEFAAMIRVLIVEGFDIVDLVEIAKWSWVPSSGVIRAKLCVSYIGEMKLRHIQLTGKFLTANQAISIVNWISPNGFARKDEELNQIIEKLSDPYEQISYMAKVTDCAFSTYAEQYFEPAKQIEKCVPSLYIGHGFIPITCLDDLHRHGTEMRNCLAGLRYSFAYLTKGFVLIKVRNMQGEIATLAVRFDRRQDGRGIWLNYQLTSRANQPPTPLVVEATNCYVRTINENKELASLMDVHFQN